MKTDLYPYQEKFVPRRNGGQVTKQTETIKHKRDGNESKEENNGLSIFMMMIRFKLNWL
jgi:hypothetical protein